ncbi:hypothetical protein B6P83_05935 [Escherichia coli]|nr:hypothetical protein [Escherichia coli]EFO2694724.1 hypothetical protein [Escherichia coli]
MAAKGLEVLTYAHLECDICVLYGAAGLGKSMILSEYAARNRDVVLIEADIGYTARKLLDELCRQLGVKVHGDIREKIDACVRELRGSGRLLMVDEAELLPYIIIPFRWLSGTYTHSSWLVVALNLVFCALIVWAHGNLSKILSLLRHPHEIKR